MPCYDSQVDHNSSYSEETNFNVNAFYYQIKTLRKEKNKLEASLCAIITELEKEGIAERLITQASKSGLIDLVSFWDKHRKEDKVRLAKELHKFSEHEQQIIKEILINRENE